MAANATAWPPAGTGDGHSQSYVCTRHPHLQGMLDWVFFHCVSLRLMEVRSFWCQCQQTAFFCLLSVAELRSLPLLVLLPCLTELLSVLSGQSGFFCRTPSQAPQSPAEGHTELLVGRGHCLSHCPPHCCETTWPSLNREPSPKAGWI